MSERKLEIPWRLGSGLWSDLSAAAGRMRPGRTRQTMEGRLAELAELLAAAEMEAEPTAAERKEAGR